MQIRKGSSIEYQSGYQQILMVLQKNVLHNVHVLRTYAFFYAHLKYIMFAISVLFQLIS